jgi:mRNA interferase MazF
MASWSTVIVAPLSTSARPTSFRTPVDVGAQKSLVLADQVQALDVAQLGKRLGALTPNQMSEVETALKSVLELR